MRISNLDDIVEAGLCAGCGICESIAGHGAVEMDLTRDGRIRPRTKVSLDPATFQQIMQVCPGVTVTGPAEDQAGPSGEMHSIFGPITSLHRGWARDENIRFHAAAGGALTALGTYLVRSGKVDAVLHMKASENNPILSGPWISTTEQDVFDGAQSRYGPGASLTHVHRLLDEGRTFAVIGKPCDIAAIRNLGRVDVRVEKQIPYCLTIFCGGTMSLTMLNRMPEYFGAAPDDLSLFRYRGEGWPGTTHMETKDGRSFDLTYDESWYGEDVPWSYDLQFRCKICPDAIGELADVSCPDGWIMENGEPLHEEAPGANLIIGRTPKGAELIREAQAAGALTLEPYAVADFEIMHRDHKPRKTGWPGRMLGLRLAGQPAMQVRGYRRLAAIMAAGPRYFLASLFGGLRRARAGLNRETGFRN
ncbi:MAG: Coenzyme F420 hydrogenase/dehydrogenase, beta subunit C-terminal domain [Alphaproteobacteria bacterium]|nr:Coenzyme F420 hydrogenase/dehydrogenase, beta subunit C-terminal domain [Alphaproteobacteria bacterium]